MNRLDLRCATASRKGESVILCHGPDFCGATRCSLHRRSACGGAKYSCGTQGCQRTQQQSARWTRSALGRALRLAFDQWCQCLRTEAPQPMGGAASGERLFWFFVRKLVCNSIQCLSHSIEALGNSSSFELNLQRFRLGIHLPPYQRGHRP
eukprot:s1138_g10.t4